MIRRPTFGRWKPAKPFKPPAKASNTPVPPKPKNTMYAEANRAHAIDALRNGHCLTLDYDGLHRVVEVHTVGLTRTERPAMSVFQVDGQSHEHAATGWRLMCFDECFNVAASDLASRAPRPDYSKGAKNFRRIDAEL